MKALDELEKLNEQILIEVQIKVLLEVQLIIQDKINELEAAKKRNN